MNGHRLIGWKEPVLQRRIRQKAAPSPLGPRCTAPQYLPPEVCRGNLKQVAQTNRASMPRGIAVARAVTSSLPPVPEPSRASVVFPGPITLEPFHFHLESTPPFVSPAPSGPTCGGPSTTAWPVGPVQLAAGVDAAAAPVVPGAGVATVPFVVPGAAAGVDVAATPDEPGAGVVPTPGSVAGTKTWTVKLNLASCWASWPDEASALSRSASAPPTGSLLSTASRTTAGPTSALRLASG